jgi:hypothetical protein
MWPSMARSTICGHRWLDLPYVAILPEMVAIAVGNVGHKEPRQLMAEVLREVKCPDSDGSTWNVLFLEELRVAMGRYRR